MEHRVCLAAHAQPALVTRRLILALPTGQRRNRCSYQVATHSIPSRPVPSRPVPSRPIPHHPSPRHSFVGLSSGERMLPGFHVCRSQLFPLSRPAPGLAAVSFMLLDTCYVLRHTSYVIRHTYDVRRARRHMLRATCYVLRATCCLRLATCCRATGYELRWFILSSSCKGQLATQ